MDKIAIYQLIILSLGTVGSLEQLVGANYAVVPLYIEGYEVVVEVFGQILSNHWAKMVVVSEGSFDLEDLLPVPMAAEGKHH
jgi:hypothetical protein